MLNMSQLIIEDPIAPGETRKKYLSFVYVKDVASAVVACCKNPRVVDGHSFNIASDDKITIDQYISLIVRYYESNPSKYSEGRAARNKAFNISHDNHADEWFPSVECGFLDISKAKQLLEWTPTPTRTWMEDTCAWYTDPQNRLMMKSSLYDGTSSDTSSRSSSFDSD